MLIWSDVELFSPPPPTLFSAITASNHGFIITLAVFEKHVSNVPVQLGRLVNNGIDPNAGDYDNRTALHLAAASGSQKSVEFLLNNNADPNVADRWGGLPLMDAVKEGHHMVALILKRKGARLVMDENNSGASADQLCNAAASGDVKRLQLLKDAGVNLDQV